MHSETRSFDNIFVATGCCLRSNSRQSTLGGRYSIIDNAVARAISDAVAAHQLRVFQVRARAGVFAVESRGALHRGTDAEDDAGRGDRAATPAVAAVA